MRNSVRVKLTCIISGLIIVFVGLLWLSNGLFLKKFYYQNKEKTLLQVYSMLDNLPPEALESKSLDLERIENRSNLRIVLLDKEFKILYESMPGGRNNRRSQFYRNPEQRNRDVRTAPGQQNPPPRTSPPRTEDPRGADLALAAVLKEKLPQIKYGTPLLENRPDARLSTNFISLFAQTRDQNYVFITTSVPAIEESVALANKFFLVTGIIVIFLGGVLAYHISLRITRPILELDGIAKGMSNLDFSKKYTGKNNDEIGTLGHSINTMSEELERSIRELQEANAKLTDDIERERKIDEMRKEFISAVSHELKTPIALIQGYAEGLRMNVNEDEENKNYYCDVIMDEAVKMNKLVVTLLDLAQIESGNAHLDVAEFQINDII